MSAALAAVLKKIALALGKKVIAGITKGVKRGINEVSELIRDTASGKRSTSKANVKKTKKATTIIYMVILVICAIVGIIGASAIAVCLVPVIVIIGMGQMFVNNTTVVSDAIDKYWEMYNVSYGTAYEIEYASESERMAYLLDYDDFWNEVSSELQFDRDTMRYICDSVETSDYYPDGTVITSEVTLHASKKLLVQDVEADEIVQTNSAVYDEMTPVYINTEGKNLTWQDLYGILCGCTSGSSVSEEQVNRLAEALQTTLISPEQSYSEYLYDDNDGIYMLEEIKKHDYVIENGLTVSGNEHVYQVVKNQKQTGNDRWFLTEGNKMVATGNLYYERYCPVRELRNGETLQVWCGTYDSDGDFESDNSRILAAIEGIGFSDFSEEKAVGSMLVLPDGYEHAVIMSEAISDGTVTLEKNPQLNEVVQLFVNEEDLMELVMSIFNIDIAEEESSSDYFGKYTDTGDYVIFDSYNGGPEVIWWSQNWYPTSPFGNSTVRGAGCGPTSLAIVYSSLTGEIVPPPTMAVWCYNNGYGVSNASGQTVGSHAMFDSGAKKLGLRVDYDMSNPSASQVQEALNYLDDGDLIVVVVGCCDSDNSIFTGAGHFLVIRGQTASGDLLLADPQHSSPEKCTNYTYPMSDLVKILNRGRYGTGRIWAIGYDGD